MSSLGPCKKGTLLMLSGPTDHLHIVMSDPVYYPESGHESILVVNITSIRGAHDETCVLLAGSHPFVRHPSYVSYRHAAILSSTRVSGGMAKGEIRSHESVSDELFERALAGFDVSRHVTPKIRRFLKNYAR